MPAFALIQAESIISFGAIEITGPIVSSLTVSAAGGLALLVLAVLAFLALYSYGYLEVPDLSEFVTVAE